MLFTLWLVLFFVSFFIWGNILFDQKAKNLYDDPPMEMLALVMLSAVTSTAIILVLKFGSAANGN